MITETDIKECLMLSCKGVFPTVPTYPKGNVPEGEVTTERIVVVARGIKEGKYWHTSVCEINYLVPDYEGEEDSLRIKAVEKLMKPLFYKVGTIGEDVYRFSRLSIGTERNSDGRYHYVNLKVLFEIQNV